MRIALYVIAALTAWGALLTIGRIGKPREPLTPSVVAGATVLNAVIVTVLVLAAMRLH